MNPDNKPWYVATLSTYVIVQAYDENDARRHGLPKLAKMLNRDKSETKILVARLATDEEIQMFKRHDMNVNREMLHQAGLHTSEGFNCPFCNGLLSHEGETTFFVPQADENDDSDEDDFTAVVLRCLENPKHVVLACDDFNMKTAGVVETYENGECPDCGEKIPANAKDGDHCENCNHVFWAYKPTDDEK